eukprot:SAG31_NODE_17211_length_679_cov_0.884483_1_plen_65_part_01
MGVRPIALGWRHFLIAPQLSSLRSVNMTVPILVGGSTAETLQVVLTQSASSVHLVFTVPFGTVAK